MNTKLKCPLLPVLAINAGVFCMCDAVVAQDDVYPQPPSPVLLDPDAPSFVPLDIEADAFARIPQARVNFGVDGSGLAVVVIDTGINPHHRSFEGKLIPGKNFSDSGGPDDTIDRDNHGSNVAGIIAGKALPPSARMPTGVAPQASIIPLKVFPGGQFTKINEALEWVILERDRIREEHGALISVVNMSLGTTENLTRLDEQSLSTVRRRQCELIRELREKNIVVTVSAGNDYFAFNSRQGMGFPAICDATVSVGAVFDTDIASGDQGLPFHFQSGAIVNSAHRGRCVAFTQRLNAAEGGRFQTDIFAPGFIMTSAGGVPPTGSTQDPATTRSTQNGTSQAAPMTAGLALLLQHRYRELTDGLPNVQDLPSVDLVENALRLGGVIFQDEEDATAQGMDNVTSCGAEFMHVDAVTALEFLSERIQEQIQPELGALQLELLRKPEEQERVLQRALPLKQ